MSQYENVVWGIITFTAVCVPVALWLKGPSEKTRFRKVINRVLKEVLRISNPEYEKTICEIDGFRIVLTSKSHVLSLAVSRGDVTIARTVHHQCRPTLTPVLMDYRMDYDLEALEALYSRLKKCVSYNKLVVN